MNWYINKSKIHGIGVFASKSFNVNEFIDVAIDANNKITYFGSLINHSYTPNTKLVYDGFEKCYYLYSTKIINKNDELVANYNHDTPPFIKKANTNWK